MTFLFKVIIHFSRFQWTIVFTTLIPSAVHPQPEGGMVVERAELRTFGIFWRGIHLENIRKLLPYVFRKNLDGMGFFGTTPHFSLVKCLENIGKLYHEQLLLKGGGLSWWWKLFHQRYKAGKCHGRCTRKTQNVPEKFQGIQENSGVWSFFWKCCSFYDPYQWQFLVKLAQNNYINGFHWGFL